MLLIEEDVLDSASEAYALSSCFFLSEDGVQISAYLDKINIIETIFTVNGYEKFVDGMPHSDVWHSILSNFVMFSVFKIDYNALLEILKPSLDEVINSNAIIDNVIEDESFTLTFDHIVLFVFLLKHRSNKLKGVIEGLAGQRHQNEAESYRQYKDK